MVIVVLALQTEKIVNNLRKNDEWFGMKDFGKIICVDLDGVVFEFDGWKGVDKFGNVIDGAVETLKKLKSDGWYIVLFTTRLVTTNLLIYLVDKAIVFDDINGRTSRLREGYNVQYHSSPVDYSPYGPGHAWKHNPEHSSIKPIASVYLDDMSIENGGVNYNLDKWNWVYSELKRRFPNANQV